MSSKNFGRLLLLAAIWGASFLFMRIAVPVLGPLTTVFFRLFLAALFLAGISYLAVHQAQRTAQLAGVTPLNWNDNIRYYFMLAFFNSALPFSLFAYAAQTLSASVLSILNATTPLWGYLITLALTRQTPKIKSLAGLVLGMVGVGMVVGVDIANTSNVWAFVAATSAAFCYGIASNYALHASKTKAVPSFSNAYGSMIASTLWLLPLLLSDMPLHVTPHPQYTMPLVLLSVFMLGVLCSGVAYLLYFKLVDEIGAAPSLTVTFLIPVFGILWGHLFLGEAVHIGTFIGGAVILCGIALVTGFNPASLWQKPAVK